MAYLTGSSRLLLSGVLVEQQEDVASKYEENGGSLTEVRERDGWLALEIRRSEHLQA